MRRLLIIAGAVAAIGIAITAAMMGRSPTPAAAAAPVPVTETVAKRQDVPDAGRFLGSVQSIDSVSVVPRVSGQIMEIYFKPGDDVTKDQPLFLIDPRPYQAALDQAQGQLAKDQAVLKQAEVDLARYKSLVPTHAIPQQQEQDQEYVVQQDKGTVDVDQANVATAKLNLEYCHVNAPIAGRAGVLQVDLGNLVQNASTASLVVVTQMKPIYVNFPIPQTMLDEVRRNQAKAALDVEAYSQAGDRISAGKLTNIDNQVNASTGTVTLQATFDNADEALWPGEFVTARLIVGTRQGVVTVPAQSVVDGPNGPYVYVIKTDDTVERQDVEVAARPDNLAVIAKGLSDGQTVVLDGQNRLDNGVKVAIQKPDAG